MMGPALLLASSTRRSRRRVSAVVTSMPSRPEVLAAWTQGRTEEALESGV